MFNSKIFNAPIDIRYIMALPHVLETEQTYRKELLVYGTVTHKHKETIQVKGQIGLHGFRVPFQVVGKLPTQYRKALIVKGELKE